MWPIEIDFLDSCTRSRLIKKKTVYKVCLSGPGGLHRVGPHFVNAQVPHTRLHYSITSDTQRLATDSNSLSIAELGWENGITYCP